MDPIAVAILIGIAVPLGYFLIVTIGIAIFDDTYKEEGTLEERNSNPELNTADLDLHKMRLANFKNQNIFRKCISWVKKVGFIQFLTTEIKSININETLKVNK